MLNVSSTQGDTMIIENKAEQKRILEELNRKYDRLTSHMKNFILNEQNKCIEDSDSYNELHDLYWSLPHYLYQFSQKRVDQFKKMFPGEVAVILELKEERNEVKSCVFPKFKNSYEEPEIVKSTKEY